MPLILNPLINLTFYVLGEEGGGSELSPDNEAKGDIDYEGFKCDRYNYHQTTRPRVMLGSSLELLLISSTVKSKASRGWIPGIEIVVARAA